MDALEDLLALAKTGYFRKLGAMSRPPVKPPTTPLNAANDPNPPLTLPAGLSGAIDALTAAEQALLDNPALVSALAAEIPTGCGWEIWPVAHRRDWVSARLGLSASRFWVVAINGRRDLVEFVEPQTRDGLLEQAARNRPGIRIEVTPALPLKALCDNANQPVDKSENPPMEPDMQQATLLPDTASLATGPAVATVSAAELLTGAGVAVRYLVEPGAAEQALSELLTLPDTGPWGLDIETAPLPAFRQDSKAGLDPWRSSIRLVQVYPGGPTCYVFDIAALGLSPLRELLQAGVFVAHNAVFELKHLLHAGAAPARLGCTQLQDNALGNGRRALATLARERLNWAMDKALQVSDWTAANLTGAQLDYAALDAVAAYQLARVQTPQLQQRDLIRCYQLMRDAQLAIARLELNGCPFDTAAHTALIAQWQRTAEQARGELDSLLNGANPDSPLQLSKWLSANLPPDTLETWPKTATGQLATDADALTSLTLPALEPLKRYKLAGKGLSTYGKGYAAHISPVTGRIHASFTIGGTATGRLSCSAPNIQNPPRDPAFRALFAPTPGRCLVVADYGQIELRVAALVSGDPAMLAVYEQGEDLHRKTAAAVLGIELEQVTKAQRQMAKACIAAGSLVLTDTGLVPIEQVTRKHLLWDGVTWVHHDGVVYQGYRQVITYDGLTATPDHVVFLETGETGIFTEAANSGGLSLARGEFEGNPVRFLGSSRGTGNRAGNRRGKPEAAAAICELLLPNDKENQISEPRKFVAEPFHRCARFAKRQVFTGIPRPGGIIPRSNTGATTQTGYADVYDIINAGPRNRFTVSGCVVHNCNFGLLYGQGSKGLQRYAKSSYGVDLSLSQADKARAAFFTAYPGLSAWQKQTRRAAELAKQVRTPGGRVRGLDKNIGTECLNTPVQGGAAECLLAALAALDVDSLSGRLVNIVHDELVVECEPEQAGAVSAAVEAAMVAGFLAIFPSGSIRDLVEAHSGTNWASAKG